MMKFNLNIMESDVTWTDINQTQTFPRTFRVDLLTKFHANPHYADACVYLRYAFFLFNS
jgi:hypothetical protein